MEGQPLQKGGIVSKEERAPHRERGIKMREKDKESSNQRGER